MANFTNLTRATTAAVGAIVLSTTFILAAVGPAASASSGRTDAYASVQTQVSVQEKQA